MKVKPRTVLFLLAAVIIIVFLIRIVFIYKVVNQDIIYYGISINNQDVGGMTKSQAKEQIKINMPAKDQIINIRTQSNLYTPTVTDLGFVMDVDRAIEEAYLIGKDGGLLKRYRKIKKLKDNKVNIKIENSADLDKINSFVDQIAEKEYREQENAQILVKNNNIFLTPHTDGICLNKKKAANIIFENVKNANFDESINIETDYIEPEIMTEDINHITYKLASFSTSFNLSNKERSHNINIACENINNTLLLPNDLFSMDKGLGERTEENGYKSAKVILNGELVEGIGGGVCQVTTTLYNTVLLSCLEVIERKNHSLPLSYVDLGRDATISEGYIDFKFRNSQKYAILLTARVELNKIIIDIWGKKPEENKEVKLRSQVIRTIEPLEVQIEVDETLDPDARIIKKDAVNGYEVIVFRDIFENNELVSTERISIDTYNPQKAIILTGKNE